MQLSENKMYLSYRFVRQIRTTEELGGLERLNLHRVPGAGQGPAEEIRHSLAGHRRGPLTDGQDPADRAS